MTRILILAIFLLSGCASMKGALNGFGEGFQKGYANASIDQSNPTVWCHGDVNAYKQVDMRCQ